MTTPTIVTRAGWGARAPRGSVATTTWARRSGVAIHHTAGPTTQTVRSIQDHQMDRNGWQDIGYNWLVDQQGRVYEGRAGGWLAIGAHAANQNTAWVGVCWIGTSGTTAPSLAALASLRWLVDEARRLAGRRLDVRGHGQVPGQATECPGSRLRAWISDGMPVASSPPFDEEDDMPTAEEIANAILDARIDRHNGPPVRVKTVLGWIYRDGQPPYRATREQIASAVWNRENPTLGAAYGTLLRHMHPIVTALGAAGGVDTGAVLARLDEVAAELGDKLEQAEAQRAELVELLERRAELGADAVVDEIARRLTGELLSRASEAAEPGSDADEVH